MKRQFLLSLLFVSIMTSCLAQKADMVIFSFDRPLQLYALLESVDTYVTGLETINVIYRASSDEFAYAYDCIQTDFPHVIFIKQGANPRQDFKPLTIQAVENTPSQYIIFAVDDNIIKDYVDLEECIELLNQTNAYGFYLRLGLNISHCYTQNQPQIIPAHQPVNNEVYAWIFKDGSYDWGYPNTVDLTLFKKEEILPTIRTLSFYSPNVFECVWAQKADAIMQHIGLFFAESKIVNLPLNMVQEDWHNRNQQELLPAQQLELFFAGKKIDIKPLYKIANQSPHMEYCPTLIDRN
ncbi:MAG: hypothetical protein ACOYT8_00155 [Candidatus Dependentiae bacterium]